MKLLKLRSDYGKSGRVKMDEIFIDEGGSLMDDSFDPKLIQESDCEVDSNGLTFHFLPFGNLELCVHETALERLHHELADSQSLRLKISDEQKNKLQVPFNKGDWFGIRPTHIVSLHATSKVEYFDGPGIKKKVFRNVRSHVFSRSDVAEAYLFRIESHGGDYFATEDFRKAYDKSKLSGLRFVEIDCKFWDRS